LDVSEFRLLLYGLPELPWRRSRSPGLSPLHGRRPSRTTLRLPLKRFLFCCFLRPFHRVNFGRAASRGIRHRWPPGAPPARSRPSPGVSLPPGPFPVRPGASAPRVPCRRPCVLFLGGCPPPPPACAPPRPDRRRPQRDAPSPARPGPGASKSGAPDWVVAKKNENEPSGKSEVFFANSFAPPPPFGGFKTLRCPGARCRTRVGGAGSACCPRCHGVGRKTGRTICAAP